MWVNGQNIFTYLPSNPPGTLVVVCFCFVFCFFCHFSGTLSCTKEFVLVYLAVRHSSKLHNDTQKQIVGRQVVLEILEEKTQSVHKFCLYHFAHKLLLKNNKLLESNFPFVSIWFAQAKPRKHRCCVRWPRLGSPYTRRHFWHCGCAALGSGLVVSE